MEPPIWFEDAQAYPVRKLLLWFIQQLSFKEADSRQRPLTRKLSKTTIPSLFDYTDLEEVDFLWGIIEELSGLPYEIWEIKKTSTKSTLQVEDQTSLVFNYKAEAVVRIWLNMPIINAQETAWRDAVTSSTDTQLPLTQLLGSSYPGIYQPHKLLVSLSKLVQLMNSLAGTQITWRQLSATCFAGDSKYLDNLSRQQWLLGIFPELNQVIQQRQLLLDVYLVNNATGILFVENQDTFCWLRSVGNEIGGVANLHLVFSRGFLTSASRARNQNCVSFYFNGDFSQQESFCQYWFNLGHDNNLSAYFWGDLDFSGLGILKSLRQSFVTLTAWVPGYEPMAKAIALGAGHSPTQAGKQSQSNPGLTGCHYSDYHLLPLLEKMEHFMDQEWVNAKHLS